MVSIGIDVGGTKIAGGLVNLDHGIVVSRREVATHPQDGAVPVLDRVRRCLDGLHGEAAESDLTIGGIGIGVPELVTREGKIASAWNFDWRGIDLADVLRPHRGIRIESDVRAAALAELRYGHGRTLPSFAYVTVGTGLSYAFCVDSRVHRGANGFAIHFGSSDVMPVCARCGTQEAFNLEAMASGAGLVRRYAQLTGTELADARPIVDGAAGEAGEKLFEEATTALASALGQMADMLDPHGLVIGGGLGNSPRYFAALQRKLPHYIFAQEARNLPVLASKLGRDSGVIGAAAASSGDAPCAKTSKDQAGRRPVD